MWDFLTLIVITFFIISLILMKTAPKGSEIYSGTKKFFMTLVALFGILVSVYISVFIINVILDILLQQIIEVIRQFLLGFGF